MDPAVDIRALEEWMYAISTVAAELEPSASAETRALLQRTLDDMRERRARIQLRRHNEAGY